MKAVAGAVLVVGLALMAAPLVLPRFGVGPAALWPGGRAVSGPAASGGVAALVSDATFAVTGGAGLLGALLTPVPAGDGASAGTGAEAGSQVGASAADAAAAFDVVCAEVASGTAGAKCGEAASAPAARAPMIDVNRLGTGGAGGAKFVKVAPGSP